MDLSGAQGELPMPMPMPMPMPVPMHAVAPPYLGLQHHHHHAGSNGRHLSPPASPAQTGAAGAAEEVYTKNRQLVKVVPAGAGGGGSGARYRECLKNHAATIGGRATDGCGEFMPGGEDGSLDALRCSACGCHRNFHRKDTDIGAAAGSRHLLHHHHLMAHRSGHLLVAPVPTRMVMPLSAMQHTSDQSDETKVQAMPAARKRFRTKFTAEQKARMLGFAEEVGWRLQKLEDALVQRFCQEVGVKRRVLKVWMHNNKHTLARRHHQLRLQLQDHHHHHPGGDGVDQHGDPSCGRRSTSPNAPQLRLE